MYILGFDIGGTKCAVVTAEWDGQNIRLLNKEKVDTNHHITTDDMIDILIRMSDSILDRNPDAIGISCGGPLDSEKGIILNPPNLPKWVNVNIVAKIKEHYGVPTYLQNDANACTVAEWKFGNGKGFKNIIFLTFGTGLGAGLILDGKLYKGANDMAGEVGHLRLSEFGPVGYGKAGSFEGFCSGSGIAQLGKMYAQEKLQMGQNVSFCKAFSDIESITAKSIAECAYNGEKDAIEIFETCGTMLGKGLSVLIDILNPERIILGSIFQRCEALIRPKMQEILEKECLTYSLDVCKVVPAKLGENIGDYAALAVAVMNKEI